MSPKKLFSKKLTMSEDLTYLRKIRLVLLTSRMFIAQPTHTPCSLRRSDMFRVDIALRPSAIPLQIETINIKLLAELRKPKPAERCFGELRDSASSVRLPNEDHSDSTNAIRSFRCAAVRELKLFLAVVACPACSWIASNIVTFRPSCMSRLRARMPQSGAVRI